jgi:hypothetical protein
LPEVNFSPGSTILGPSFIHMGWLQYISDGL